MDEVLKRVQERQSKSKLILFFKEYSKKYSMHFDNVVETGKKKSQDQLRKFADILYPLQCQFLSPSHEYSSTWVLQGTDQSIPFLISSAASFAGCMEAFEKGFDKVKQSQPLFNFLKENYNHKHNQVLPMLLDDLQYLSEKHDLVIDKKEIANIFKAEKDVIFKSLKL